MGGGDQHSMKYPQRFNDSQGMQPMAQKRKPTKHNCFILVGEGSVINGAYPVYFYLFIYMLEMK